MIRCRLIPSPRAAIGALIGGCAGLIAACAPRAVASRVEPASCFADDTSAFAQFLLATGHRWAQSDIYDETRARYGMRKMAPDEVRLEADEAICTRAVMAYNDQVRKRDPQLPVARRLTVVRLDDHWLAADPDQPPAHFRTKVLFDRRFKVRDLITM
jgi:hypothetical protein